MLVVQIECLTANSIERDQWSDLINGYLAALRMNGQICGKEWPILFDSTVETAQRCQIRAYCKTTQALANQHNGSYVRKALGQLAQFGISTTWQILGPDLDGLPVCACTQPSAYVLFTTYLSLEPPVRCLDCWGAVPLYTLPLLPSGEYYELVTWQSDYQSCDALQMNCSILERTVTRELSRPDSALSKQGRALCQTMTTLTGKPFYYYLYRASGRSHASEMKRHCPGCGDPFTPYQQPHQVLDLQCNRCQLFTNIGWNVRR
ncbi:DUF2310 family Zn-ribbon-containing protein [Parachitinimonas caeni]|uniref:DUF2310 family Zn-ribbon-containing protein n=1 Tax=Parachitinimonas caeni TaxID=3031301 RepID=A0ABT7E475_9NEIS|nr:DUF2310 family Zn-ribbon-containing protein [Parachitinimonas caeni]MDK2126143.1 DUF2310 family Zn-ribbon-containing protein [Parachitinimonas caeni]